MYIYPKNFCELSVNMIGDMRNVLCQFSCDVMQ